MTAAVKKNINRSRALLTTVIIAASISIRSRTKIPEEELKKEYFLNRKITTTRAKNLLGPDPALKIILVRRIRGSGGSNPLDVCTRSKVEWSTQVEPEGGGKYPGFRVGNRAMTQFPECLNGQLLHRKGQPPRKGGGKKKSSNIPDRSDPGDRSSSAAAAAAIKFGRLRVGRSQSSIKYRSRSGRKRENSLKESSTEG